MKLEGRTAIVIGGANGMGKCYCDDLLKNGVKVLLCDINEAGGRETRRELASVHGESNVIFRKCDGTDEDDVRGCMQDVLKRWGHMDIVINHVGIVNELNWKPMLLINIGSAVVTANVMEELVGKSSGGPGGVLIHTASRAGVVPAHMLPIYSGTKAAMVQYTRALMHPSHYNRHGICMMCICPSIVKTNMFDDAMATGGANLGQNRAEVIAALKHLKETDTWIKPEEVSAVLITMLERSDELAGCAALLPIGESVRFLYQREWDHLNK